MKVLTYLLVLSVLTGLVSCRRTADCSFLLTQIENNLDSGNLKKVGSLADSLEKNCQCDSILLHKGDSLLQVSLRIPLDFSKSVSETDLELKNKIGDFTPAERELWESRNWLEGRMINGEKRYFNRAVSNLRLINDFYFHRHTRDSADSHDPEMVSRRENTQKIIAESGEISLPVEPVELKIEYTLTIKPGAVPGGKKVRCWLPYPREDNHRQTDVRLISSSDDNFIISPDSSIHRTIYMEGTAQPGIPLSFSVSYSYKSCGQYFDPEIMKILPFIKNKDIYRKYTAEQPPQIRFTDEIKHLTDSITGDETRPFEIVRKIYMWFSDNIAWAGAQEYSIIPDIPAYVIKNKRGDCGMQTLLLMSMLRYKGIPVRWESGWKVPPDGKNLHDWCEVYIEGNGWFPLDVSYGLQYSGDKKIREFFISGIDSYRLIVNNGISGKLYPGKKFMRSEPYDFQRGEVEWDGGNLYFDKWNYEMKITYLK